jgi:hypothetical protein
MPSLISAGTSTNTAVSITGDTSGALAFATNNGTTAVTITTGQQVQVNTGGSASAPVISKSDDTNTGIFFPAADTIAFAEGGTEVARFDSSGTLNIGAPSGGTSARLYVRGSGTTSSTASFEAANSSGATRFYVQDDGTTRFFGSAGSETARIDSSGNLGIGTASPGGKLHAVSAPGTIQVRWSDATNGTANLDTASGLSRIWTNVGLAFGTGAESFTERMRIASNGYLGIGISTNTDHPLLVSSYTSDYAISAECTHPSNPMAFEARYTAAAPNNSGVFFFLASDTGATRMQVRSNGGIGNFSGNNVNLSDIREKKNINLAGSYLDKICAIPVKTFNYIDQNQEEDDGLTLGVIAQDVQAVAPELVSESDWGTEDNPKMRLSVYQTDLQYALMKCIQEQQSQIEELRAEIQALKGQ